MDAWCCVTECSLVQMSGKFAAAYARSQRRSALSAEARTDRKENMFMVTLRLQIFPVLPIISALILAGCSSTELVNQWSNPAYTSASFKRILVIGVTQQASIRRNFEDAFVAQL